MCQATTGGNNPTKLHSCETLHCSGFVLSYLAGTTSSMRNFFWKALFWITPRSFPPSLSPQASPPGHHSWSHRSCPPDDQTVSESPLPQRTEPPETGKNHNQTHRISCFYFSKHTQNGAKVALTDYPTFPRQTALHLAVITEQPQLVEKLLKAGSDPRLSDDSGNTALHIACKKGSLACFSLITQNSKHPLTSIMSFPNYSGKHHVRAELLNRLAAFIAGACLLNLIVNWSSFFLSHRT